MMLESGDREKLVKRLRSGEIGDGQFTDEVCNCVLATFTKRMQLHEPDLPSFDPDNCLGYFENLFTFKNAISKEDSEFNRVLRRAENVQELVDDIFDDWGKLRLITNAYSGVLVKRWIKRTVPKRKKILLDAWPGMNPAHRPDFEVIRRDLKGPAHRDALLIPYINLEDLSSEKNLLQFMDSRTKVHPEYFAFTDSLTFKTAVKMEAVKPAAQYCQVMLLTGQKSRDTYGKLRSISDTEVENIVWTGYAFQLAQGIVILETQQRLYSFLLRCAEHLLHDIDISQVVNDADIMDRKEHYSLTNTIITEPAEWQSVSKMNSQASYRLPQPFSLDLLQRLAGAERDAAEDVFWALHEDPGFFQERLASLVQQSLEPCRRAFGEGEPSAQMQAGIHIVLDVCHDIIVWEAIDADLEKLKTLKDGLSTEFQLSERLPPDYEEALENFIPLIFVAWKYAMKSVLRVMISSHKLIDYFDMVPAPHGRHTDFSLRKSATTTPILRVLADLNETGKTTMMGALNILDEFERILESDTVQRDLIDTDLIRGISKLAALSHIQDALVRHQPTIQAVSLDHELLIRHHVDRLGVINELEEHLAGTSLGPYTKPNSAFVYPVGKKPTLEHVDQMRRAEAKLDNFWDQVDNCKLMPRTGKNFSTSCTAYVSRSKRAMDPNGILNLRGNVTPRSPSTSLIPHTR